MSFDLLKIFHEMGLFARGIALTLLVMGVAILAVMLERLVYFTRTRRRARRLTREAAPLLPDGRYRELAELCHRPGSGALGALLGSGLTAYLRAQPGAGRPASGRIPSIDPAELARREMERHAEETTAEVRRGLGLVASVGTVAPFVGLLGTVVGIISAFQGIAREGSGGLGAVSAGIAEALVVTAFGLLVAIPAVLVFNSLSARADQLLLALDRSRGELVDQLASQPALPAATAAAPGRNSRLSPEPPGTREAGATEAPYEPAAPPLNGEAARA